MPTRFWLSNQGAAPVSPAFDPTWNLTGDADRCLMLPKLQVVTKEALANGSAITVPITTTQEILARQFVSAPLRPMRISGQFSLVIRAFENATTNNVTLDIVVRVVSNDGGTVRGTLLSTLNVDSEFALSGSAATRHNNALSPLITPLTTQQGDRLVIEVGGHATAPTAAGSFTMRYGCSAATDFAVGGVTTDLNPWCEFSDLVELSVENFRSAHAGDGVSVSERTRW